MAKKSTRANQPGNPDPYSALPFIGKSIGKGLAIPGGRSFWNLPAKGGYRGGNRTGQAAALAFLKFLREVKRVEGRSAGSTLQLIVLDMLGRGVVGSGDSLCGQAVGFFSEIEEALYPFVQLMEGLDSITFESLASHMREGLARTKADERAELRQINSDIARRGWQTRRRRIRKVGATAELRP
jgi:hypothetical protein